MSFASLGLVEPIMRAVAERGYTAPTPIQAQAIPAVLAGGDLMAGAQTGTGKTAGFTLPILHRLASTPAKKPGAIRVLVLTPTRELAAQVEESVREYGKYLDVRSMVMFGGVSINPQITALRRGVDILVATPGRLLDHVQQKTIDLSSIEILVLDEADRMLDMGFIRDIKKVLALLPKQRQNLLFSATFSDDIKALADGLLNRPAMIEVARRNATTETVGQQVMVIEQRAKRHLLAHLIREKAWFQVLVFTRTKHGANRLAEQLAKSGIPALAIHGNKSQNARTRALAEFKDGSLQVLVATDIAARGLDIVELPHVVNFELPNVPEDYVHRIGRTGRAGATGEALSLVAPDEMKLLADIEKFTKRAIPRAAVPAFELPPVSAEPAETRPPREPRGGRQERGGRSGSAPRRAAEGSDARAPKPRRQRVAEEVARSQTEAPRQRRAPQARDGQAEARPASRSEGRGEGAARRGRSAGQGAPRDGGAGAGRTRQGRNGQDAPRSSRGEANGNVFPSEPREVNGNVIPKPRPDADGNRARANRQHEGRREGAARQDAAGGGIAGVFKRGLNALRRFGES